MTSFQRDRWWARQSSNLRSRPCQSKYINHLQTTLSCFHTLTACPIGRHLDATTSTVPRYGLRSDSTVDSGSPAPACGDGHTEACRVEPMAHDKWWYSMAAPRAAITGGAIIDHDTPRERRIVAVEK